jgi:diacylglycerol kinase family enzyme
MFLILNSKQAGGFKNLNQRSVINDGMFEFMAVKANKFYRLPNLLFKFFQNKPLQDSSLIIEQDNYFKIEITNDKFKDNFCDIDGEKGPAYPFEISVKKRALKIFTP